MAFTDADMAARDWLHNHLDQISAIPHLDGAGNLCGRLSSQSPDAPSILIGSHTDTVPRAGMLDGSLGVLCGLEVLRILHENQIPLARPVELISFSDEEGRFGGMLGSQAFAGMVTPEILQATDLNGKPLSAAMQKQGLEPLAVLDARRDPGSLASYLELHIEQGPVLDHSPASVGIVENITGLRKWLIRLRGEANHAGTTPMNMRKDAFMGLADFAHELPRILDENGAPDSRATIGSAQIVPGAANTVPGEVEFSLDLRDTEKRQLEELTLAVRRALSAIARRRDLSLDLELQSEITPASCDPKIISTIEKQANKLELPYLKMPSGAAHDAQIMATVTPTAMIFVPSKDGVSHTPAEWTDWADIENGANLLLQTVLELATN
jgi:N-carbamoyl-L-amino-acid hydrolase